MPSSASAPASPPSASHSQNSATQPSPRKNSADGATNNDGRFNAMEKKPDLLDQFEDFDNFNSIEKYKKYEADYAQRLMAKYFSKKNLYGGNIFEENTTVDDEIIKSSGLVHGLLQTLCRASKITEAAVRHPPWKSTVPSQMGSML